MKVGVRKHNRQLALVTILLMLAVARLLLTPRGHFHLQDELRYRYSFAFIREVVNLDLREALAQLFQFKLYARPTLVLFNLPTALLQVGFLLLTGIKTETPLSLTIPSVVQVFASLGISWLFYKLGRRYLKSDFLALTGLVVYSLLINTNLYLRHIVPYDTALLVYFLWLTFVLKNYGNSLSFSLPLVSGLLVAVLHLVYPAFYLFGLVIAILVTFLPRNQWFRRGIIFTVSFFGFLLLTEFGSRLLGSSYLADAKFVASRVIVGNPRATFIFLFRYLLQIEKLIGVLLIFFFSLFLIHFLLFSRRRYSYEFRCLTVAVVGCYLLHAASGPLAGKVFYGRSIHMFFWFVVLGALMFIEKALNFDKTKNLIGGLLVGAALFSFSKWYPQFLTLDYPSDVLYQRCKTECVTQISFVNENYPLDHPTTHLNKGARLLAINFGRTFWPVEEEVYSYDTQGGELIYQQPHPLNFLAYQFEAHTLEERVRLQNRQYQMKLYRLP